MRFYQTKFAIVTGGNFFLLSYLMILHSQRSFSYEVSLVLVFLELQ
jgi:hypothetical protein